MRLVALDEACPALGLSPGMTLATAQARAPGLVTWPHKPEADRVWLERIADACDRFTPMVALDGTDGLTLDITGCAHLFGGEAGLGAAATALLRRQGLTVRHALAATPLGAQGLARHGTGEVFDGPEAEAAALRRLPVAALRLDAETEIALHRVGLRTVGDLASRPSAPIAARFGMGATDALDRLLGHADSRIVPRRPPPALSVERRFAEPLLELPGILAALDALVVEAAAILEGRGKGGRCFTARLYLSNGATRTLSVETSRPSRDPAALRRLFAERIEGLADPLDPGYGFDMVRLDVPVLEPMVPAQARLPGGADGNAEKGDGLAVLLDRLSTRLGPERVRRFAPVETHIPERAARSYPAMRETGKETAAWPVPTPGEPPLRPLHLFHPPQPVEVAAAEGAPALFRWRRRVHELRLREGPERIAPEWWRREIGAATEGPGGVPYASQALTRDYWRVEDWHGRRFWLFRQGLEGQAAAAPRWFLHGLFV